MPFNSENAKAMQLKSAKARTRNAPRRREFVKQLVELSDEMISVKCANGETIIVSAVEAVGRSLIQSAIKGNPFSQRLYADLYDKGISADPQPRTILFHYVGEDITHQNRRAALILEQTRRRALKDGIESIDTTELIDALRSRYETDDERAETAQIAEMTDAEIADGIAETGQLLTDVSENPAENPAEMTDAEIEAERAEIEADQAERAENETNNRAG